MSILLSSDLAFLYLLQLTHAISITSLLKKTFNHSNAKEQKSSSIFAFLLWIDPPRLKIHVKIFFRQTFNRIILKFLPPTILNNSGKLALCYYYPLEPFQESQHLNTVTQENMICFYHMEEILRPVLLEGMQP